jgi:FAD/FMN-containing dehydrogenase
LATIDESGRTIGRALAPAFGGTVIDRDHLEYDSARRVWNSLVDRRPAVIARCSETADVVEAVRVAAQHRPAVSIRAGGHQVAGSAVCDDGLVIDLSTMKGVHVDPASRTARVQAGVTWGELDRETQVFGLAAPGGEVTGTGVAGLTLGGGLGLLMRAYGLSCDHLRSFEIVTADGVVRTVDADRHPDLLWAARGCGRGLGVVTSLELDLHVIGPTVAIVQVYYPIERAEPVLRAWRDLAEAMPAAVTPQAVLRGLPPYPQVPSHLHGAPVVAVGAVYAGPPDESEAALAPLRRLDEPLVDLSCVTRYEQASAPPGLNRAYMKSHFLDGLSDEAIRTLLDQDTRRIGPDSEVVIRTLGGAIRRACTDGSAYPHRAARFNLNVNATWRDPALDDAVIDWCRSTWTAMRPHANGGVYMNFSGLADEVDAVRGAVYGASAARLDAIRARHDPDGVFRTAACQP